MVNPPRDESLTTRVAPAQRQAHTQARTVLLYRRALTVAGVLIVFLVILLLANVRRAHRARMIVIDGQSVCLVEDQAAAKAVREYLLRTGRGTLPGKAAFAQKWEEVAVTSRDQHPLGLAEATQQLRGKVTVVVEAAAIAIGGAASVKLPSADVAHQVIEAVKAQYAHTRDGEQVLNQRFVEDVTVQTVAAPPAQIIGDVAKAVAFITRSKREAGTYTVKAGDIPDKIAAQQGMKVAELFSLNPGLKGRNMKVGETLKISTAKPLVTVITVRDVTHTETFDAPVERVPTPSLPKGQEKVEREGTPGERTLHEQQTCANWRVIKRTVIQQTITRQPVARRVLVSAAGGSSAPNTKGAPPAPAKGR